MTTLTLPKKILGNDDLIIMPRREYEALLRVAKRQGVRPLNRDLTKALIEVRAGKTVGTFNSAKELEASLEQ